MSTSTTSTESKTDSTVNSTPTNNTGYGTPPVPPAPVSTEPKTDDFGYETPTEVTPPAPPKPAEAPKDDKPVETPSTGYGKEEEAPKETPKETQKEELKPDEEKLKTEITETVKSLGDGYNHEKITKFALENKLTKEQLKAYVDLTKAEEVDSQKAQQEALKTQRSVWKDELLKDPEFGGEHFDKNVDRVEKVLQNYMPGIKKVLTEKGNMLPPYIMRDFLALAKILNPTNKFVNGEQGQVKKQDGNFLEEMYE